jgi:anti-anti-sigma regulatory factor
MSGTQFPARLVRGIPVIAAPVRIDAGNAALLQAAMAEWIAQGHATVVVDLSRTQACDEAGRHALIGAHRLARDEGGGLRLAHCGQAFAAGPEAGPDRSLRRYASVIEAVSELPSMAIEPIRDARSWLPSVYASAGPAVLASARKLRAWTTPTSAAAAPRSAGSASAR